jgi:hypothetical protein
MDGIFISYRRDDASGYAGRLYDRLVAHFGARRVFMDVEGIEPGADFVTAIETAVGSCRVLIVVIGDEWLNIRDAEGRRRLDDPHDFIRLEVAAALARSIRVVPVLVDGATMPRGEDLPPEMQGLARRQAIAVHHQQWEASTASLIQALQRLLGEDPGGGSTAPRWALAAGAVSVLAVGGWWVARGPVPEPAPSGTLVAAERGPSPVASPAPAPSPPAAERPAAPPPVAVAAAPPAPPAARPAPAPAAAAVVPRAPRPPVAAAAPEPAPAPAARAPRAEPPAAAPPAPATADPRWPQVGQRWTYRVQGKWPTSPVRLVEVTVAEVRDGVITDRLLDGGATELRRSRAGRAGFVKWPGPGLEFSPYLAAGELAAWSGEGGIATPDLDEQWTRWSSDAKPVGREAVSVPAGRFEALKVEVWSHRVGSGSVAQMSIEPVRIHYLIWYAPEAGRYVRMQRRVLSANGQEVERDVFELVARRGG